MRRKKRKLYPKVLAGLVVLTALFGIYAHNVIYTPVSETDDTEISIIIKKGSKLDDIAASLEKGGLLRSRSGFYFYTRLLKLDRNIIAGRFMMNKTMNIPQIVEKITSGAPSEYILTVQEGLGVSDIDAKLVEMDLVQPGEFIQATKDFNNYEKFSFLNKEKMIGLEVPLEGYLYPDTYFLDAGGFHSLNLIDLMLKNFERKLNTLEQMPYEQQRGLTDVIIMASILQKEVRTPKDYGIVSGILWKRYDSNWHIGADATILYVTNKNTLNAADLAIDSPYNTRRFTGMPPGPICNPAIEYIQAALQPVKSEYWYYLTTLDTGEVIYAKTNDEHNINKARYLR